MRIPFLRFCPLLSRDAITSDGWRLPWVRPPSRRRTEIAAASRIIPVVAWSLPARVGYSVTSLSSVDLTADVTQWQWQKQTAVADVIHPAAITCIQFTECREVTEQVTEVLR